MSLVMAAARPVGSKDWLYLNPLISILPRVVWSVLVYVMIWIGPKRWLQIPWLIFIIFITYWVHSFISDFFKFAFYVWVGGYSWHQNSLIYSLSIVWGVEHLIEVGIYLSVIPLIWVKIAKTFKNTKLQKEIVVFDYSRTIAFGKGKERSIPDNIKTHLKSLTSLYEVVVITGRKERKVIDQLHELGIYSIISKNGLVININGNFKIGYAFFFRRYLSLKLLESTSGSKIKFIVSDNKNDEFLSRRWKLFRPSDSPFAKNNTYDFK